MKDFLYKQWFSAYEKNRENILSLVDQNEEAIFLDLGCGNGDWISMVAKHLKAKSVFGTDIEPDDAKMAEQKGIKTSLGDINDGIPFENDFFDVVHSNQTIEHVYNTDTYVSEVYRVLKPGGYAVISTENLASWHNIFALTLGFTPFSLTNASLKTRALANPFSPCHNMDPYDKESMHHKRVFTTKGLKELCELYQFTIEKVKGAGYYPFGNLFSGIDANHSAFIALKVRK